MSNPYNTQYLENMYDKLQMALEDKDEREAESIAHAVKDAGFEDASEIMWQEINKTSFYGEDYVQVAPGVYQSKSDVDTNMAVDELKEMAV